MSEAQTYQGSCHCGNVRYETQLDLSKEVLACDCSMCGRMGYLLAFVPAGQFKLLAGEGKTTDYLFNKKAIHHLFCSTCGVRAYAQGEAGGQPMYAVNVRCIEGLDLKDVKIKQISNKG